jgi:hypothetical protein
MVIQDKNLDKVYENDAWSLKPKKILAANRRHITITISSSSNPWLKENQ